jgi:hypothetical protein
MPSLLGIDPVVVLREDGSKDFHTWQLIGSRRVRLGRLVEWLGALHRAARVG